MTLILVVDDEAAILALLEDVLAEAGYETMVAHNGHEALCRLAEQQPSLVLSDVMMPLTTGVDLARTIKATPGYGEIPVVLMTAGGPALIAADVPHAAVIAKPFDLEALLATLRHVLASGRTGC